MKDINEQKIYVTQVMPNDSDKNKVFVAGNAKNIKGVSVRCDCQEQTQESEQELDACSEGCNCIIAFCSMLNIPDGFGVVSLLPSDRKIYYTSNLYYVVDTEPCVVSVSPPEGCLDLNVDIYAIRIVGNINYEINIQLNSSGVAAASDTGSVDNFVIPSRSCCQVLSSSQSVDVNQVVGYITSPQMSPVLNGEAIPAGQIQVAFTVNSLDCSGLTIAEDGQCINCSGNFKVTRCPLTDVETE